MHTTNERVHSTELMKGSFSFGRYTGRLWIDAGHSIGDGGGVYNTGG